jgi:hypothetical protein
MRLWTGVLGYKGREGRRWKIGEPRPSSVQNYRWLCRWLDTLPYHRSFLLAEGIRLLSGTILLLVKGSGPLTQKGYGLAEQGPRWKEQSRNADTRRIMDSAIGAVSEIVWRGRALLFLPFFLLRTGADCTD